MSGIEATKQFVTSLGLPSGDRYRLPSSPLRFPDGGQYRIEIPSVEGPNALKAVFDTADALAFRFTACHRAAA